MTNSPCRRLMAGLFVLPLVLPLLSACETAPDTAPPSLYPLQAGKRWQYIVSGRQGGQPFVTTSVVTNATPRVLAGRTVTPQHSEMFGQTILRFIAEDSVGVSEIASQMEPESLPEMKDEPNFVLKNPIKSGSSWTSTWQSAQPDGPFTIPITKTIVSTDETVTVPGGTFDNVVRLAIAGSKEVPTAGTQMTIVVAGDEWYAPTVGFVKGSFEETVVSAPDRTIRFAMELEEMSN